MKWWCEPVVMAKARVMSSGSQENEAAGVAGAPLKQGHVDPAKQPIGAKLEMGDGAKLIGESLLDQLAAKPLSLPRSHGHLQLGLSPFEMEIGMRCVLTHHPAN